MKDQDKINPFEIKYEALKEQVRHLKDMVDRATKAWEEADSEVLDLKIKLVGERDETRRLEEVKDRAVSLARLEGVEEGLREYAWWKDGVEYVGTCGGTLKQAINNARKKYNQR